ncbi:hypothetical protein OS493_035241 [Desmophyllum pertusum]|uniref:PiggyBac transposable element-derived protein domain-containing protein n=1 Tax=Desmophyllum pertusum TaxID=174260 RepID=A0A9W9ZJ67_9CNID|nr:hypothetical protein OS493_035241 [Desmophyllum pertusum]
MASDSADEITALFEDSGDEGSFTALREDLDDLEAEEDDAGPDDPQPSDADTDDKEEARWTDHLIDIQVPEFLAATGINLVLDNPNQLDFFLAFVGDDLLDFMVEETNRYAHQKLSAFPDRLANFRAVTCAELKASLR